MITQILQILFEFNINSIDLLLLGILKSYDLLWNAIKKFKINNIVKHNNKLGNNK